MSDHQLAIRSRCGRLKSPALLRRIVEFALNEELDYKSSDLTITFLNDAEMTRLNETRLRHAGTTDVISFDYGGPEWGGAIVGELFVCVDEAKRQARLHRATFEQELVRYVVHGILHLAGHDDSRPSRRTVMRQMEDGLVAEIARHFELGRLTFQLKARAPRRHV